jgi:HlyD family secretion protein
MDTAKAKRDILRKRLLWGGAAVVVIGALGTFALTRAVGSEGASGVQPTFEVRRGPLTISVVETGTIKSQEQVSLKNEVEGQTTLIYLIPEGTPVKAGDLLVELDGSKLQDELTQQQISVDNADAAYIRARENLAVAKNQAASDISKAELDYQFAEEDVSQYVDGLHPKEVKEAESNITLAREELERANEKLIWSERLFEEKYISQTELESDRLAQNRSQLNYELAVASLQLLEDYTSKRKLAELESNVDQMKMALERVKLKANADVVQAEASLKAADTELRQQKVKFEKFENQISKTKILAPRDGLVVYATSVQTGGRRFSQEPLQEGQSVRERQELIYLPSIESMMAEVQIHESSLEKVRLGLPVRVTADALPGKMFTGKVASIAPLPDAASAWMNPDLKVYPTKIFLDGVNPELRTGMSCRAEIIIEQHADALYVPVQAVIRIRNEPTIYVRDGGSFKPRAIQIGLDNNSMVHVLSGLDSGEEVTLTPRLDAKSESIESAVASAAPPPAGGGPAALPGGAAAAKPAGAESAGERPKPMAGEGPPKDGGPPRASDDERTKMRERFQNLSPEEQEKIKNMTPEERRQYFGQQRQQRGEGGGDRPDDGQRREGRRRSERGPRPEGEQPAGGPPPGGPPPAGSQPSDGRNK